MKERCWEASEEEEGEGRYKELICFTKKGSDRIYQYIGNYNFATESDGTPMIGEFEKEKLQLVPGSPQCKEVLNAIKYSKKRKKETPDLTPQQWVDDKKNWRVIPIKFNNFDCELWNNIKTMNDLNN